MIRAWVAGATAVLLLTGTVGCTKRIADFSILSKGTPQYHKIKYAHPRGPLTGKDGRLWFLIFPLANRPTIEEAVDRCIDQAGGGDFMERVRIYQTNWSVLLFSYGSYTVLGEVGNTKDVVVPGER